MAPLIESLSPVTLGGPQEDPTVSGILSTVRSLLSQPTLPNDPMSRVGAIFSGFGAGVQGRENPVISQALKTREQELTKVLALAQLAHSARTEKRLQQSARFQQAKDWMGMQTEVLKQQKSLAEAFPENPALLERYIRDQATFAGVQMTPEQATKLASDSAARAAWDKNLAANVLFGLTGEPLPPGVTTVLPPESLEKLRTNPVYRAGMLQAAKLDKLSSITDPSLLAEKTNSERAKIRWETSENLAKQEALGEVQRATEGKPFRFTAAHALVSGVADREKLGFLLNILESQGSVLSPSHQSLAKSYREEAFSKGLPAEARLAISVMELPPGDPRRKPLADVFSQMSDPFRRHAIIAAATEVARIQQNRKLGQPGTLADEMKLLSWEEYLRSTKGEVFMVLRDALGGEKTVAIAPPFTGIELGDKRISDLVAMMRAHGTREKALEALRADPSTNAENRTKAIRAINTAFPVPTTPLPK